jgi:hypothetical protein
VTFGLELLKELFFFNSEKIVDRLDVRVINGSSFKTLLHRKLILNHFLLFFGHLVRENSLSSKIVQKLCWHLLKRFFGENHRIKREFSKAYELYDVCRHLLIVSLTEQRRLIGI